MWALVCSAQGLPPAGFPADGAPRSYHESRLSAAPAGPNISGAPPRFGRTGKLNKQAPSAPHSLTPALTMPPSPGKHEECRPFDEEDTPSYRMRNTRSTDIGDPKDGCRSPDGRPSYPLTSSLVVPLSQRLILSHPAVGLQPRSEVAVGVVCRRRRQLAALVDSGLGLGESKQHVDDCQMPPADEEPDHPFVDLDLNENARVGG